MEDKRADTAFSYTEIYPPAVIAHLADGFLDFSVKSAGVDPIPHEVFPDGCISLLYRRNERLNVDLLLVKGISLKAFSTEVFDGDIHWGIRFSPAACAQILRCRPEDLPTTPVSDHEILTHLTKGLRSELGACQSFPQAAAVYTRILQRLKIRPLEVDQKVREAVEIIRTDNGEVRIAEVARAVGLSARQLERRFRNNSGITPKQFLRVHRLRATSINLMEANGLNWAGRAAEMGFADQSHLNREFSALTGRTPRSFAEFVGNIECGGLID